MRRNLYLCTWSSVCRTRNWWLSFKEIACCSLARPSSRLSLTRKLILNTKLIPNNIIQYIPPLSFPIRTFTKSDVLRQDASCINMTIQNQAKTVVTAKRCQYHDVTLYLNKSNTAIAFLLKKWSHLSIKASLGSWGNFCCMQLLKHDQSTSPS